ncbi:TPA: cupin domain-containing protein [Pseudomonas aeruginosa]
MSVKQIISIALGQGDAVRPEWPDGMASDSWHETEYRCFSSASGSLFGGTWCGEPGQLVLESYPYDELCVMLSGHVALVDDDGARKDFKAGDAFLVPFGFSGSWLTLEPSSKIFIAIKTP